LSSTVAAAMLPAVPSVIHDDPAPGDEGIQRLAHWVEEAPRILFITGAGISADSGLPTDRGVGGLYDDRGTDDGIPIEEALSGEMMEGRPELCWKYLHRMERACRGAVPNRAHEIIAGLERRREGVVVLTQNVDGLHGAAGSAALIEMHGNVHDLGCTRCAWEQVVDSYEALAVVPRCPECEGIVRPRVVLFGEVLPEAALARLRRELELGFSLVVTVGTTAVFPYIAEPVRLAPRWGAQTVEINPGTSAITEWVDLRVAKRAAPTFDALAAALGYG